jgi:hypothetical protein
LFIGDVGRPDLRHRWDGPRPSWQRCSTTRCTTSC